MGDLSGAYRAGKVCDRIALGPACDHGKAVDLPDDLQQATGGFVLAFLLNGLDDLQNIQGFHPGDVFIADDRENVLFHAVHDRAPMFLREVGCPGLEPFQGDIPEHVLHFRDLLFFDDFPLLAGVNAISQELFGLHALFTGLL